MEWSAGISGLVDAFSSMDELLTPKLAFLPPGVATTTTWGGVGGDISSVFPSLSGISPPPLPDRYAELRGRFTAGREKILTEFWERLLPDLEKETAVAKIFGGGIILQVEFKDLGSLPKEKTAVITKRGAVVLKNVLPDNEALGMKESLKAHIRRNTCAQGFSPPRIHHY
ncbi:unnamed protein product [Tuber aestivum]|uniref:Uncharacterized protein n=1 Tax=Tuber aestivum TaxID=59557 RepID=A0A292PYV6_9PEZI|nr:unnamed protein product [Tuber aestivum]